MTSKQLKAELRSIAIDAAKAQAALPINTRTEALIRSVAERLETLADKIQ